MSRVIKQSLKKVEFGNLKRLKNVTVNFEGNNVTGIFGPNGCGKSTILHALACIYRPLDGNGEKNYFTRFFKGEKNQDWKNSYLRAFFDIEGKEVERLYRKGGDHWSPRLEKRLERVVKYIGIGSCVPDVEKEPYSRTKCYLSPESSEINNLTDILSAAKCCLKFEYDDYHLEKFASRKYQKVNIKEGISYSSLAMGTGEQRLFSILQELYSRPPYSLLLIDEIDLTLHTSALQELINIIIDVAKRKNLQVIFTSHREELASRSDINVRHIWYDKIEAHTCILQKTTPECIARLTGKMEKSYEVYVEDDLSEAIVKQVLRQNHMLAAVEVIRFGDATNAFLLAASDNIRQICSDNVIFILDGDVYRTYEAKMALMKKFYSGTESDKEERRKKAISYIKQYRLPEGEHPEHYLWKQIQNTTSDFANMAKEIIEVRDDQHKYLYEIQRRSGENREVFLYKLMNELSNMDFWQDYVSELQGWLDNKKSDAII